MRMSKPNVMQLLASTLGVSHPMLAGVDVGLTLGKAKGQLRQTRPKASGAAQLKRAATKRNNIRKHK